MLDFQLFLSAKGNLCVASLYSPVQGAVACVGVTPSTQGNRLTICGEAFVLPMEDITSSLLPYGDLEAIKSLLELAPHEGLYLKGGVYLSPSPIRWDEEEGEYYTPDPTVFKVGKGLHLLLSPPAMTDED